MLFRELVQSFLHYNQHNRSARTLEFYRAHLSKFLKAHADKDALELRPYHVLEFKCTWHLVMSLQRLYRWAAEEQDLLPYNPLTKLRRPRLGARRRVLSRAELLRLLRGARWDFRAVLLAARESAARPQELRTLAWEDLHWPGAAGALRAALYSGQAYFLLEEYKGRSHRSDPSQPRIIPISPRLGRLLWRLCRGQTVTGSVFLTAAMTPWNRNSLRLRMRRLRQVVNVPEFAHGERVVLYTLRHSAATELAARGLQTNVLQALLGHSNVRTTQRYVHLAQRQLMDTWQHFHDRRKEA